MKRPLTLLIVVVVALIVSSCNWNETIGTAVPPTIVLDSQSGVYSVKQGRELRIAPQYENAEGATFEWVMDGKTIGTERALLFAQTEQIGEYYILLRVTTEGGEDEEELRVDVVELEVPTISMGTTEYLLALGEEVVLSPVVKEGTLPISYRWVLDGRLVGEEPRYTFVAEEVGEFALCFESENEDGADSVELRITVQRSEEMAFEWRFDQTEYNYSTGRRVRIAPVEIKGGGGATYLWSVDGVEVKRSEEPMWVCEIEEQGIHKVVATAVVSVNGVEESHSVELTVRVCPPEGTFRRQVSGSSSADWSVVWEYCPAPGQFINDLRSGGFDGTQTTPEAARAYVEERWKMGAWISLGAFGGYVVVGFDHSIENSGGYDFGVIGNSFEESSEPGVVWVMQDENGDGEPNDTWYQLRGSETGAAGTVEDYAVTYYRPAAPQMGVQWSDNMGGNGVIDYLPAYHNQEYYYPLWVEAESYTLRGTRLEARNVDESGDGTYWVQPPFGWGYADNFSETDRLHKDGETTAERNTNFFRISDAIDFEGKSVELQYIDFVKVQTALNTKSGWLGENSTELLGIYDNEVKSEK